MSLVMRTILLGNQCVLIFFIAYVTHLIGACKVVLEGGGGHCCCSGVFACEDYSISNQDYNRKLFFICHRSTKTH